MVTYWDKLAEKKYKFGEDKMKNKRELIRFCINTLVLDEESVRKIIGWYGGVTDEFCINIINPYCDGEWFDREEVLLAKENEEEEW